MFSYERDLTTVTTAFTCLLCINHMILKEWFDSPRYLAHFWGFWFSDRLLHSSNSWICHLQKFCVGEAPRSYVPAPVGGSDTLRARVCGIVDSVLGGSFHLVQ